MNYSKTKVLLLYSPGNAFRRTINSKLTEINGFKYLFKYLYVQCFNLLVHSNKTTSSRTSKLSLATCRSIWKRLCLIGFLKLFKAKGLGLLPYSAHLCINKWHSGFEAIQAKFLKITGGQLKLFYWLNPV